MLATLNVTEPFFALVLCGYLAARYRMLPENAVPALNTFVLYFALPCMLFRFAAGAPFHDILNLPVFLAYMVTGLAVLALSAATARYAAGENVRDAAFAALAVAWSNTMPLIGRASSSPSGCVTSPGACTRRSWEISPRFGS